MIINPLASASPRQPPNAPSPMFVTLSGIVTFVSPLQPSNAQYPMLVTLSGITTFVSPLQPSNAQYPMLITGHPPSDEGTAIAPTVEVGIAANHEEEEISALPSLTV